MNDQQQDEQASGVRDQAIRAALDQHWAASEAGDLETEHLIYHDDAVLDYPQSGERTRGRSNIQKQRAIQPSKKKFSIRRIIGGGNLWVTEYILTYDGKPSYTVSIMEFSGDKVARETQYFADPFPGSRISRSIGRTDGHIILGPILGSEGIREIPGHAALCRGRLARARTLHGAMRLNNPSRTTSV